MSFSVQSAGFQAASIPTGTDISVTVAGRNPNASSVNRVFAFDFGSGTSLSNFSPSNAQNGSQVAGVRANKTIQPGSFSASFRLPSEYLPKSSGTYDVLVADFPYGGGYDGSWPYNTTPEASILASNALTITTGTSGSSGGSSSGTSGQAVSIGNITVSPA